MMESDDEDEGIEQEVSVEISKHELVTAVRSMSTKLEDLRTCNDLITKHGHALQRSVGDLETAAGVKESGDKKPPDMSDIAVIEDRLKSPLRNLSKLATNTTPVSASTLQSPTHE